MTVETATFIILFLSTVATAMSAWTSWTASRARREQRQDGDHQDLDALKNEIALVRARTHELASDITKVSVQISERAVTFASFADRVEREIRNLWAVVNARNRPH